MKISPVTFNFNNYRYNIVNKRINFMGQDLFVKSADNNIQMRNEEVLNKILSEFKELDGVEAIGIGGSSASKKADSSSDIDIYVFTSKDMSLRVGFDLIAYITEFLLPFWLIAEIFIQAFHFVKGYENCILSSIILVVTTAIFFTCGFIYSLKKYANYGFFKAFYESIVTSIYFITIWFPIAMFIIFKIIFTKKTMDWDKTQHGVSCVSIKELINE